MKLDFTGKIAVITGSSAGIGFAAAKSLYEHGATIVLNGRSEEKLIKIRDSISNEKSRILVVEANLGNTDGVQKFLKAVPECDILVNNMGIYYPKPFLDITDEDWTRIWEVNFMSSVRLSRHYLKGMLKKNWGRMIFISSESALQTPVEMIHYGVTKTAQLALARGIAELTVRTKVTSNSVIVGPTISEGVADFVKAMAKEKGKTQEEIEKDFFKEIRPSSLLQRFITPEEVANMVTYLCSEEASATNGSAVRVDGGVVKTII